MKQKPALLLTISEIRYLLSRLLLVAPVIRDFVLRWSLWRRYHQAEARAAHYRRHAKMQL
jgi:hypothetical protein